MFVHNRIILCVASVLTAMTLAACGNQQGNQAGGPSKSTETATPENALPSSLKITSWGPDSTKAGEVFNQQPDGSAAFWVHLDHSVEGDVVWIQFNGAQLQSDISGNLVTAKVPASLYAKSGTFKLDVIARRGNQSVQSNGVIFVVK